LTRTLADTDISTHFAILLVWHLAMECQMHFVSIKKE